MKFSPSLIEYIGEHEGGILASIGLMYEGKFYDSIFYYTDSEMLLTISEELETIIGKIEENEDYLGLMEKIINIVDPYENIINSFNI